MNKILAYKITEFCFKAYFESKEGKRVLTAKANFQKLLKQGKKELKRNDVLQLGKTLLALKSIAYHLFSIYKDDEQIDMITRRFQRKGTRKTIKHLPKTLMNNFFVASVTTLQFLENNKHKYELDLSDPLSYVFITKELKSFFYPKYTDKLRTNFEFNDCKLLEPKPKIINYFLSAMREIYKEYYDYSADRQHAAYQKKYDLPHYKDPKKLRATIEPLYSYALLQLPKKPS